MPWPRWLFSLHGLKSVGVSAVSLALEFERLTQERLRVLEQFNAQRSERSESRWIAVQ
jgi:hypothetical protein